MPVTRTKGCRVAGITSTFPATTISSAEAATRLGIDYRRFVAMTGIEKRPIAQGSLSTGDLCFDAAVRLTLALDWPIGSIDGLIVVTQTPDHPLPATACILHGRLGLSTDCACFDIGMGCSGYVYGLQTGFGLLNQGCQRVLLLVGDTVSRFAPEDDRSVGLLFGDCGTATALERGPDDFVFVSGTDGRGAAHLQVGVEGRPGPGEPPVISAPCQGSTSRSAPRLHMNGAEVVSFALREVPSAFERLLEAAAVSADQIDLLLLHQANRFIVEQLGRRMGIPPERVPVSLPNFGNTSGASIPVTMAASCNRRLCQARTQIAMMGFGVGWSWAGAVGPVGPIVIPPHNKIGHNSRAQTP